MEGGRGRMKGKKRKSSWSRVDGQLKFRKGISSRSVENKLMNIEGTEREAKVKMIVDGM